ncbi:MAG: LruC domain-containing protein [Bacteroidia bacterium]|nr:LruC domain-containing protein [Bacteroidia bacterium]
MRNSLFITWTLLLFVTLIGISCKMEIPESQDNKPGGLTDGLQNLYSDPDFSFNTCRAVKLTINSEPKTIFQIYSDRPINGGKLMAKGITKQDGSFQKYYVIPTFVNSMFVRAQNQKGEQSTGEFEIINNSVHLEFDFEGEPLVLPKELSCDKADQWLNSESSPVIQVAENETYAIQEGDYYEGGIEVQENGRLIICGKANLSQLKLEGEAYLEISGELIASRIIQDGTGSRIMLTRGSRLTLDESFDFSGSLHNQGRINIAGSFTLRTNGADKSENFNRITVGGDMHLWGELHNKINRRREQYGHLMVAKTLYVQRAALISNSAYIETGEDMDVEGRSEWLGSYGKIGENLKFQHTSSNKMAVEGRYGNLIETKNFKAHATIDVKGKLESSQLNTSQEKVSVIKVSELTKLSSGMILNNNRESKFILCDLDGVEMDASGINWGSNMNFLTCKYIRPTGPFFPKGEDMDRDGIPNSLDDFPKDPNKSFTNYTPSSGIYGTYVFEDLYPKTGDFDFNDMVVRYQYQTITNSEGKTTNIVAKFLVKAVGAAKENGFGVKLDGISKAQIKGISGLPFAASRIVDLDSKGLESAPSEPVLIVYDNVNEFLGMEAGQIYNTGNPTGIDDPDTTTILIELLNPIENPILSFKPIFFIDKDRTREVQLKDEKPTNLFNRGLYGTDDDASRPMENRYFRTESGMPWVMDISGDFQHMRERNDITTGYLKIVDWINSNGETYQDWFSNESPDYRMESKLIKD